MDKISAMNAFVRVVEAGSFARAADSLGVPRPTITRLVQGLETQLQVRLLHRTTRSLTLTVEGGTFYDRVVHLLADLEDIVSTMRSGLAAPEGRINVAVSVSLGSTFIVPALAEFRERHPGITVALDATNRDVDLVAENLDCAIRIGAIVDESLVARRIGGFRFLTCAAPAYVARRGRPARPEDLMTSHSTVGFMSYRTGGPIPFEFTQGSDRFDLVPQHVFMVNDTNAQIAAAVSGLGVIQAPSFAVRSAISEGKLIPVLQDWLSDVRPTSVIYPPNRYLSAKVRVFVDWLVELFENDPELSLR